MVCRHCGATTSAALDRCEVCRTPNPAQADRSEIATTRPASTPNSPGRRAARIRCAAFPASGTMPVLQPGQQFGRRYTHHPAARIRRHGRGLSRLGCIARRSGRAEADSRRCRHAGTERRDLEARFKRELKLARQVTHPNVVRIHDLGEVEGTLYLTMEYVQGADLATLLQREPTLPLPRALALARQIASGLASAHRAGIVHRDLKPANVMVDALGHAQLMDFGIARSTSAASVHTMPGSVVGTLDYMAPEQARGEPADERADVYAFGLILYELVAGGRPKLERGRRAVESPRATGERAAGSQDGPARRRTRPRADCEQVPVFEPGGTLPVRQRAARGSRNRSTTRDADSQPGGRVPPGLASRPSCCSDSP